MGELLKGKRIADEIDQESREELAELRQELGVPAGLAIITAGHESLKQREVLLHVEVARKLGIVPTTHVLGTDVTEEEVIAVVQRANTDPAVHGVLLLLPLPEHIDQEKALQNIAPQKELEGLLEAGENDDPFGGEKKASTIAAVLALLKEVNFNVLTQRAVLLIDDELLESNPVIVKLIELTGSLDLPLEVVTTSAPNARAAAASADALLVSVSRPESVGGEFIKEGAVVIDFNPVVVGERYSEAKQAIVPILKNGIDLDATLARARYVAASRGGVGPVALAMMMRNLIANYRAIVSRNLTPQAH
jgi:methylenetetrahydrofolate dehydrogenase (NADP+)/methenyltetrahydrofolate cyclohydrolase